METCLPYRLFLYRGGETGRGSGSRDLPRPARFARQRLRHPSQVALLVPSEPSDGPVSQAPERVPAIGTIRPPDTGTANAKEQDDVEK